MRPNETRNITIIAALETGDSLEVADELFTRVSSISENVHLVEAPDYDISKLPEEDIVLMVTSTQGAGEPPFGSEELYEYAMERKDRPLGGCTFAVLGLGDSSYAEDYNLMAREFDAAYERMGGRRLMARGECDYDFEETAAQWIDALLPRLEVELGGPPRAAKESSESLRMSIGNAVPAKQMQPGLCIQSAEAPTSKPAGVVSPHARTNELQATLIERELLTSPSSAKQVYRIRLKLSDSSLQYQPGDLVAIRYDNTVEITQNLLATACPKAHVSLESSLFNMLMQALDITKNQCRSCNGMHR